MVNTHCQSLLSYDNKLKFSGATLTLSGADRDWTREGVGELSLWFRCVAAAEELASVDRELRIGRLRMKKKGRGMFF